MNQVTKLPVPKLCDRCCSPNIRYVREDELYGVVRGTWPYIWLCDDCRASVGCHPDSNIPLGKMANSKTRRMRRMLHDVFDLLWFNKYLTRDEAYNLLAKELRINSAECHIGWLTDEQLFKGRQWAKAYLAENEAYLKRKVRKDANDIRRDKRERQFNSRQKFQRLRKSRRSRSS